MEIKIALGVAGIILVTNFPEAVALTAAVVAPLAAEAYHGWNIMKFYSDSWQAS